MNYTSKISNTKYTDPFTANGEISLYNNDRINLNSDRFDRKRNNNLRQIKLKRKS